MEFGSAHRWGRSVSKGGRAFGLCLADRLWGEVSASWLVRNFKRGLAPSFLCLADRLWGEVSATPVLAGTPSPAHRLPPCVSTGVVELSASTLLTHGGVGTHWPVAVLTDSACRLLFDTPSMSANKATTAAVDGYPGNKVPPAQTLFVVVLAVIVVWERFSTRGSLRADVCAPSSVRNNLHAEALPQPPDPSPVPPAPDPRRLRLLGSGCLPLGLGGWSVVHFAGARGLGAFGVSAGPSALGGGAGRFAGFWWL